MSNPDYPSPYPSTGEQLPVSRRREAYGTSEHIPTDLCAMTAAQYQSWAITILQHENSTRPTTALGVWRWDSEYMARSATITAENAIRAVADTLTRPRWTRRFT
jgi:hypothetical protein